MTQEATGIEEEIQMEEIAAAENDLLATTSKNNTEANNTAASDTTNDSAVTYYNSPEELLALVSERLIVQRTPKEEERLDPLERAFRYLVPIPKHYYWDVVKKIDTTDDADTTALRTIIPRYIKVWHHTVAGGAAAGDWTHRKIALPIAGMLGLTGSRFYFVTDQMTEQDMARSQRIVSERRERDKERNESSIRRQKQEGDEEQTEGV